MPSVQQTAEAAPEPAAAFDARAMHRTHSGLGPSGTKPELGADAARPAAASSHADSSDPRSAAVAALSREAPVTRVVEGKVIPFPAQRRDDELGEPTVAQSAPAAAPPPPEPPPEPEPESAAPPVTTHSLSDALRESAAAVAAAAVVEAAKAEKTHKDASPPVPSAPSSEAAHAGPPAAAALLAGMVTLTSGSESALSAESAVSAGAAEPAEPAVSPKPPIATESELASTLRAEPAAVDLTATALLGSPAESKPQPRELAHAAAPPPPAAALAPAAASPQPEPAAEHTPAAALASASATAAEGSSVEDVHDEFFSAGEAGSYVGGPISELPGALDEAPDQDFDELSVQGRRVIRRTPEQEARRERNIKMVSGLVGVGLAIACVALWRSHRAGSSPELAPPAPQISNEVASPRSAPLEPAVTALIPAPPADRGSRAAAAISGTGSAYARSGSATRGRRAGSANAGRASGNADAAPTPTPPSTPAARTEVEPKPRPTKPAPTPRPADPEPRPTQSKPPTAAFPL